MDFIYIHGKLSTFLNLTYESLILLLFCGWGLVTAASHILQGTQKKTVRSSEKDWQFLYCARTNWANISRKISSRNEFVKSIEVDWSQFNSSRWTPTDKTQCIWGHWTGQGPQLHGRWSARSGGHRGLRETRSVWTAVQRFATAQRVVNGDRFGDGHLGHQQWQLAITTLGANLWSSAVLLPGDPKHFGLWKNLGKWWKCEALWSKVLQSLCFCSELLAGALCDHQCLHFAAGFSNHSPATYRSLRLLHHADWGLFCVWVSQLFALYSEDWIERKDKFWKIQPHPWNSSVKCLNCSQGAKRWRIFDTSAAVPRWPVLDAGMSDRPTLKDSVFKERLAASLQVN